MFRRLTFLPLPTLPCRFRSPSFKMSTTPQSPALHTLSRKAVAIALNYRPHAAEMSTPVPEAPVFFFKPSTAYLPPHSGPILLPSDAVVEHEVELGVVISKPAKNVPASRALDYIAGYVLAIDLTARNWQKEAKEKGRPWSLAKGCDTFCPISHLLPVSSIEIDQTTGIIEEELYLQVNGLPRQKGSTRNMIFTVPQLIEDVSRNVTLEEWDIILTGTPEGVGPIRAGDVVKAGIEGLVEMEFDAIAAPK